MSTTTYRVLIPNEIVNAKISADTDDTNNYYLVVKASDQISSASSSTRQMIFREKREEEKDQASYLNENCNNKLGDVCLSAEKTIDTTKQRETVDNQEKNLNTDDNCQYILLEKKCLDLNAFNQSNDYSRSNSNDALAKANIILQVKYRSNLPINTYRHAYFIRMNDISYLKSIDSTEVPNYSVTTYNGVLDIRDNGIFLPKYERCTVNKIDNHPNGNTVTQATQYHCNSKMLVEFVEDKDVATMNIPDFVDYIAPPKGATINKQESVYPLYIIEYTARVCHQAGNTCDSSGITSSPASFDPHSSGNLMNFNAQHVMKDANIDVAASTKLSGLNSLSYQHGSLYGFNIYARLHAYWDSDIGEQFIQTDWTCLTPSCFEVEAKK